MSISVKEIAWVAGILEGEGTFCLNNESVRFALAMTDLDIVEKVRNIVDKTKIISSHSEQNSKDGYERKTRYTFTVIGDHAISWMMTIYPLMGLRRKTKIRELLQYWKVKRAYGSGPKCDPKYKLIRDLVKSGLFTKEEAEKKILELMVKN